MTGDDQRFTGTLNRETIGNRASCSGPPICGSPQLETPQPFKRLENRDVARGRGGRPLERRLPRHVSTLANPSAAFNREANRFAIGLHQAAWSPGGPESSPDAAPPRGTPQATPFRRDFTTARPAFADKRGAAPVSLKGERQGRLPERRIGRAGCGDASACNPAQALGVYSAPSPTPAASVSGRLHTGTSVEFEETRVGERDAARIFGGHSGVPHPRSRTSPHRAAPVRTRGLERRGGGTEGAQPSTTRTVRRAATCRVSNRRRVAQPAALPHRRRPSAAKSLASSGPSSEQRLRVWRSQGRPRPDAPQPARSWRRGRPVVER